MVVKPNAKKVRRIGNDVLAGFAGSTADAFTLLERLEERLEEYPGQLTRACVELAKAWRTDKYLRRLEAVLLVCDKNVCFELTGNGDVLEPMPISTPDGDVSIMGVGSGGAYALGMFIMFVYFHAPPVITRSDLFLSSTAAARALADRPDMGSEDIARKAMVIAAELCVYTNGNVIVESIDGNAVVEGEEEAPKPTDEKEK